MIYLMIGVAFMVTLGIFLAKYELTTNKRKRRELRTRARRMTRGDRNETQRRR